MVKESRVMARTILLRKRLNFKDKICQGQKCWYDLVTFYIIYLWYLKALKFDKGI